MNWGSPEKKFEDLLFWRTLVAVSLVLGHGLEHSCPWPREGLFSERLSLASDFFCVLGLGLEPSVLDSTSASNLHLLAGIAPPEIRREAAGKQERLRQVYDPRHMLFNYKPAPRRLKSRKSFLRCVDPLEVKIKTWREEASEIDVSKTVDPQDVAYQKPDTLSQLETQCFCDLELGETAVM